ncbi:MAG: hypothetical protein Q4B23_00890 [Helcococcus sp.]|nr:hypothetical protein [Helcococcus sp.]
MKKTQHILIISFAIFLYFLLSYYNFTFRNAIPLFIIMCSEIYYHKDLKYRKNSGIYLLIVLSLSLILTFVFVSKEIPYLSFNMITDGIIVSIVSFLILKYFIYE